jgi:uncharacterized protein
MTYTALITGASSGIGEATARRLARDADTRVILVARREPRLRALADEIGPAASVIAADLTEADAPARIRAVIEAELGGSLQMLVNNAGARWSADFADAGWANVERHMRINFEAPVRLTEALLPLLRAAAASAAPGATPDRRVCVVNVASTAARVGRPGAGAYSASKFALAGWSESLYNEERPHGVHVGLVLPGFVQTEGFPARELIGHPLKRRLVARPELVAEAILQAGPGGRAEHFVPRFYAVPALLRAIAPWRIRRATAGGAFTTRSEPSD